MSELETEQIEMTKDLNGSGLLAKTRQPRKRRPSTDARHEDKRLLILTTAAELFATLGYEATSLDLIAEHVGIHKATLYHYISNKESILYVKNQKILPYYFYSICVLIFSLKAL